MIFASGINSLHATVAHLVNSCVCDTVFTETPIHGQTGHAISKDHMST